MKKCVFRVLRNLKMFSAKKEDSHQKISDFKYYVLINFLISSFITCVRSSYTTDI